MLESHTNSKLQEKTLQKTGINAALVWNYNRPSGKYNSRNNNKYSSTCCGVHSGG